MTSLGGFLATLMFALPASARAGSYAYSTIVFPGDVSVSAINDQGQLVGSWLDAAENNHGFLWQNGTTTPISPPGALSILGLGINNAGTIVGSFNTVDGSPDKGFTLQNGTYTIFPRTGTDVEFYAVNNSGEIVGEASKHRAHAGVPQDNHILTVQHGHPTTQAVGSLTTAYGLNDAGTLIGDCYLDQTVGETGFVKPADGPITPIVVNGTRTYALGIDRSGTVVGYDNNTVVSTGFVDRGGTITEVRYPGLPNTEFYGLNDLGQIVGLAYGVVGLQEVNDAFVLQDGVYTPVAVPDSTITEPDLINNAGVIAGTTYPVGGNVQRGFVAVPHR